MQAGREEDPPPTRGRGPARVDPGALLRRVRRLARLSQRQLADRAGVSMRVVSRIESGEVRNPGIVTVDLLVRAAVFLLELAVDDGGERLSVAAANPFEGLRDLAGRRLPAHLEALPVGELWGDDPVQWWGWPYRWSTSCPERVPERTFKRRDDAYWRPPLDPVTGAARSTGTILDWKQTRAAAGNRPLPRMPLGPRGRQSMARIGVFALQGDVREHVRALEAAGCVAVPVRRPAELAAVDGLVLPGGESTTMIKLARTFELLEPLRHRIADGLPVYGSCAGMILLADRVDTGGDQIAETIGGLDVTVRRNAFGRQVDSFEEDVDIAGLDGGPVRAVFIRAPWVQQVGAAATSLGATSGGHVVAVRQGPLLATSFHPEMTGDGRLHAYFCAMVTGDA